MLAQFQNDYADQVRFVFRQFPLSFHDKATIAATATEAAGLQGKFLELEHAIFECATEWSEMTPEAFTDYVTQLATDLGLDMEKFATDWQSDTVKAAVDEDYNGGIAAGVGGTPTIFINGRMYGGQRSYEIFEALLELYQLEDRQYSECPPTVIDTTKTYTATLKTEKGDIVIELYDDIAPITVNSFVFLAREGWFDNVTFHRVIKGFVAQTGDPLGKGYGGPGYTFRNEIDPDYTFDGPGVVGMANSGENKNGSQFFISYTELPDLNGSYTIFGRVIEGMDVVESLTERNETAETGALPAGDKILSVEITEE